MRATIAALFAATFLFTAGAGPAFAAPADPSPTKTSRPDPKYFTVVAYDSGRLTYVRIEAAEDRQTVDVSDMKINLECAFDWLYSTGDPIRINLLEQGCAQLLPGKGTAAEKRAQKRAPKPSATPATSASTSADNGSASGRNDDEGADVTEAVSGWVAKYWQVLLSTLLGIGSLTWTVWAIYHRRVRVVLIGAPAAGKTGLWTALKDGGRAPDDLPPSRVQSASVALEPMPFGKYTLYPVTTDIPGSQPGRVLDELERSRAFRWKRKLVLVVVLSPTATNQTSGSDAFDQAFIDVQKGYMSLPRGIIGSKNKRRRPDLVLLFISKFDLVSKLRPEDAPREADHVTRAFAEHQNMLSSVCKTESIPFFTVLGSSTRYWGMDELRTKLQRVIKP